MFTTSSFLYTSPSTLGEPKPSRSLQVSNPVSLLASREHASIIAWEFTPHSLRPAAQAMNAPAVITHSQKLPGSFIQHSLNLFPEKMPMDAPTDCHEMKASWIGCCDLWELHCTHCALHLKWIICAGMNKDFWEVWPTRTESFNQLLRMEHQCLKSKLIKEYLCVEKKRAPLPCS